MVVTDSADITFEISAKEWLEHIKTKVRLSSYAQYKVKLEKNILPFFEGIRLKDISAETLHIFMAHLSEYGVSEGYARDIMRQLKTVLKYVFRIYGIPDTVTDIEYHKTENTAARKTPVYDDNCFARLCHALKNKADITKAGIMLTLFTGLRIGELCALKWEDIDLDKGMMNVGKSLQRVSAGEENGLMFTDLQSKAGARTIPLTGFLCEFLEQFKADESAFFLSGKNTPIEPRTMQYRLRSFLKKESLPEISFSELRKLFISRCANGGADITVLSEILGNSTVQSTVRYYSEPTMDGKVKIVELAAGEVG